MTQSAAASWPSDRAAATGTVEAIDATYNTEIRVHPINVRTT